MKSNFIYILCLCILAPDKRDSNPSSVGPPAPPKRLVPKRNTEWSADDDAEAPNDSSELRDSGISTTSLSDFQSHLTNLNNLSYEDFEPRTRCNDIMNISPPSAMFQGSQTLSNSEVI